MKNIFLLLSCLVFLSACGKGDGGGGETERMTENSCVFSKFSQENLIQLRQVFVSKLEEKTSGSKCNPDKIYQNLSAALVFELVNKNRNTDVVGAIENNNVSNFVLNAFDKSNCQIHDLNTFAMLKQCKWEE